MKKINYLAPKVKTAPIVSSLGFAGFSGIIDNNDIGLNTGKTDDEFGD